MDWPISMVGKLSALVFEVFWLLMILWLLFDIDVFKMLKRHRYGYKRTETTSKDGVSTTTIYIGPSPSPSRPERAERAKKKAARTVRIAADAVMRRDAGGKFVGKALKKVDGPYTEEELAAAEQELNDALKKERS